MAVTGLSVVSAVEMMLQAVFVPLLGRLVGLLMQHAEETAPSVRSRRIGNHREGPCGPSTVDVSQ